MKNMITAITGFKHILPTHQGRAAENVLFSCLVKEGDFVPGNSHFDTTKGHIESRKAFAIDCTIDEAKDTQLEVPFKGNVDPKKLEKVLTEHADKIPFVIVTITNNTAGGQPVSMQNLKEVREIANRFGKYVLCDAARFAENAYFIKIREGKSMFRPCYRFLGHVYIYTSLLARARALRALARSEPSRVGTDRASRSSLI